MSDAGETAWTTGPTAASRTPSATSRNAAARPRRCRRRLREASRARLDLMAAELAPLFSDPPPTSTSFDFTISSGLQPRLWIDAVSHVGHGTRSPHLPLCARHADRSGVIVEDSALKPVARPGRALTSPSASSSASG